MQSVLLTSWEVGMRSKIQQIFDSGWDSYASSFQPSVVQGKAAHSITACKSGSLGCNISQCGDCGHVEIHNNSCRNRNCPNCQAVLKEIWIDARKSEVIDTPYFHVVFTVPAELNPLIYANQKLLYTLLHKCSSETLLELSSDKKYLGAAPGIIQVLHTWGQTLNFHPHIHCIITGGGLTKDYNLKMSSARFFIPVKVLGSKFRGKFLAYLKSYHRKGKLFLPSSCRKLRNSHAWAEFRDSLYQKAWCPYIKETFNGFGNAIEYLGRYTHRIAITNSRIVSVTENEVSFRAKDYRSGDKILVRITPVEFIRRLMMHVLPAGFQKIRYYGFLNNRRKKKNLHIIFRIQGHRKFVSRFTGSSVAEIMKTVWKYDISLCPCCGKNSMRHIGRSFALQD